MPGSSCGRPGSNHVSCIHMGAFKTERAREGGGFFKVSFFSFSHPINFPRALLQQSLWFSNKLVASQASLQVLLFQHLNHITPSSLFFSSRRSALTFPPSLSLPLFLSHSVSLSLSLSTMVRSHGRRQLAGCRLASMATRTLPLPQVSLATSSLAL